MNNTVFDSHNAIYRYDNCLYTVFIQSAWLWNVYWVVLCMIKVGIPQGRGVFICKKIMYVNYFVGKFKFSINKYLWVHQVLHSHKCSIYRKYSNSYGAVCWSVRYIINLRVVLDKWPGCEFKHHKLCFDIKKPFGYSM